MQQQYERAGDRRGGITIPRIWLAVVFSIAIHSALLWTWRFEVRFPSAGDEIGKGPLIVRITPPPSPPPAQREPPSREVTPTPPPQAQAKPPRPQTKVAKPAPPPRKPAPEVLARRQPVPDAPLAPPPAPPSPPVAPAPQATAPRSAPEGDLSSLVEARRRARGETAAAPSPASPPRPGAAEDANARATQLAAANLGSDRKPSFGSDPRKGGGVFGIERMSYDSAEFTFFGWNKDIQRNTLQLIEVRKGSEPDIRIAIVRRMIAIIREQEKEDFVWESKRLGRNVTLSARLKDSRGLEDFLMREFF